MYQDYLIQLVTTTNENIQKYIQIFNDKKDSFFEALDKLTYVTNAELLSKIKDQHIQKKQEYAQAQEQRLAETAEKQKQYVHELCELYKSGRPITNHQFKTILEWFNYFGYSVTKNFETFLSNVLEYVDCTGKGRLQNKRCRLSTYKCLELIEMLNNEIGIDVKIRKPSQKPVYNF